LIQHYFVGIVFVDVALAGRDSGDIVESMNEHLGAERRRFMKLQDGDVLVGKAGEYDIELTVTKVCKGDACWTECDAEVLCNGKPMVPASAGAQGSEPSPGSR
jgi:hypothetical protein